jgi:hypothetical protein
MVHARAIERLDPGDRWNPVDHAGREEEHGRAHRAAALQEDAEFPSKSPCVEHLLVANLDVVRLELATADRAKRGRPDPVTREIAVQAPRGGVPVPAVVEKENASPSPPQHERRAETGGTTANDDGVVDAGRARRVSRTAGAGYCFRSSERAASRGGAGLSEI